MKQKGFLNLLLVSIIIVGLLQIPANAAVTTTYNGYILTADGYNVVASNTISELRVVSFEILEDSSICISARIIFRQYGSSREDIIFSPDTNCLLEYSSVGNKNLFDNVTITLHRLPKEHINENSDFMCDFCKQYIFDNFNIINYDKTTNTTIALIPAQGTYTVIFVDYGENNKLSNFETKTITTNGKEAVPVPITKGFTLNSGDKIMLWENMTVLVPICDTLTIE